METFWSWLDQQKPVRNTRMEKAHDLNIYGYLKFLPEHRPTKKVTDDQLIELASWSVKLQAVKLEILYTKH